MDDDGWPTEWLRGVLELCTLAIVGRGPSHGYAVAQQIEAAGLGVIKGGTLYPILTRLETAGLLSSVWQAGDSGPGRKVFHITEAGRATVLERGAGWRRFSDVTQQVLALETAR